MIFSTGGVDFSCEVPCPTGFPFGVVLVEWAWRTPRSTLSRTSSCIAFESAFLLQTTTRILAGNLNFAMMADQPSEDMELVQDKEKQGHNDFSLVNDKIRLGSEAKLMAWSPTMDLLALVTVRIG